MIGGRTREFKSKGKREKEEIVEENWTGKKAQKEMLKNE